ncbi:unnamed protein product [Cylicocyclus nassatus]|uniref:MSP domain-containing protein n=1 Tax=Cylicocyclus nassatus TaxID=53992 RepID=A0AA36GLX3_CYLNA|nr:unnamed protein product [Cylicocyclus nassatus]
MALIVSPTTVIFNANGGTALVHLTNPSQTNLAYSIVCLNKQNYHFGKKEGLINAGESKDIKITRTKGPPGKDAFLIQYAIAEEDGNNQQRTSCYVIGVDQIYVNMYAYL